MCSACSTNGKKRNACRILVGRPEGKRQLQRPRRRWVDNIKMDVSVVYTRTPFVSIFRSQFTTNQFHLDHKFLT
jgi:hypothetical protein